MHGSKLPGSLTPIPNVTTVGDWTRDRQDAFSMGLFRVRLRDIHRREPLTIWWRRFKTSHEMPSTHIL